MTEQAAELNGAQDLREGWRRNMWAVWLGELLAIAGFNAALPFLPYYVQELGITAPGQVELWTGLLASAQAWMMAVMSPVWGSVADRFGRKLMLTRALFGGALLLGAMAFVQSVHQLLALRFVQGAVTGTVAAAYTLVAASTPAAHRAFALGFVQMGVYLGGSLGPALGGFAADLWGYRACFAVTGVLLAGGGVVVAVLVRENRSDLDEGPPQSFFEGLRTVMACPEVLRVFAIRFLFSSALRMVDPLLPLLVQSLAPDTARVASHMGVMSSAYMATMALGTVVAGRYAARLGVRRVLLGCLLCTAALYLPQSAATSVSQLLMFRALAGLAIGGLVSALSAQLAEAAPEGREGTVFGLQSTVHSVANAVAPVVGGTLAASLGLRVPFVIAGLGLVLAAAVMLVGRESQASRAG